MRSHLTDEERRILLSLQDRLLWLTVNTIHHANSRRANPSPERVGGHQSSSTSVLTLLTAIYFKILRTGDRIVEIAGTPVREPDDVAAVVNTRRPNDEVRVVVERGGQRRTLTVKLGEQPDQVSNP